MVGSRDLHAPTAVFRRIDWRSRNVANFGTEGCYCGNPRLSSSQFSIICFLLCCIAVGIVASITHPPHTILLVMYGATFRHQRIDRLGHIIRRPRDGSAVEGDENDRLRGGYVQFQWDALLHPRLQLRSSVSSCHTNNCPTRHRPVIVFL